ncbi:MAG: DUF1614 domain-containing protein [Methanomassiliicoccales archaeon]|nr:DUF1614 domain-containing protein [Methanomassiliicoccales archaeon]
MLDAALVVALVIAGVAIVAIMVMAYRMFFSQSLMDNSEDDPWTEPLFNALAIVAVLAFCSWFNLRLIGAPVSLEMNVTGAIVPIFISAYLLVNVRAGWRRYLLAITAVAALGYLATDMGPQGVYIHVGLWILVVAACATLSYLLAKGDLRQALALAYVSASLGMLFGGDVLQLVGYTTYMGVYVIGIGGLMDFVFLSGVVAVALIASAHYLVAFARSHMAARQRA